MIGLKDKIIEILERNQSEFKGTNEANLHSSEEIRRIVLFSFIMGKRYGFDLSASFRNQTEKPEASEYYKSIVERDYK